MKEVNLSRIRPEARAEAWQRLQDKYPAQADAVRSELTQLIKKEFDAEVIVLIPEDPTNA